MSIPSNKLSGGGKASRTGAMQRELSPLPRQSGSGQPGGGAALGGSCGSRGPFPAAAAPPAGCSPGPVRPAPLLSGKKKRSGLVLPSPLTTMLRVENGRCSSRAC